MAAKSRRLPASLQTPAAPEQLGSAARRACTRRAGLSCGEPQRPARAGCVRACTCSAPERQRQRKGVTARYKDGGEEPPFAGLAPNSSSSRAAWLRGSGSASASRTISPKPAPPARRRRPALTGGSSRSVAPLLGSVGPPVELPRASSCTRAQRGRRPGVEARLC